MLETHKSEHGTIEYMLPSIPETLELWGRMGLTTSDFKKDAKNDLMKNDFMLMSKVLAHMGFLIRKVDMKVRDTEVKSYEAAVTHFPLMGDLCEVAGRILKAMMDGASEEKKKPSRTR